MLRQGQYNTHFPTAGDRVLKKRGSPKMVVAAADTPESLSEYT
jgi:hypothetical protein